MPGAGASGDWGGARASAGSTRVPPEPTPSTTIEATTRAPPRSTDQPIGSPDDHAKRAAKTGSSAKTTAVVTADNLVWAHDWTTNANAVAATAVISTARHSPPECGSPTPRGTWTTKESTPTVKSWTAARP